MPENGDNFERHKFARLAFALAQDGLRRQEDAHPGVQGPFDFRLLGWFGAAQAVKEAWVQAENRPSKACRLHHNWVGITPIEDQEHIGEIRIFKAPEECWLSWAYYPLRSSHYDNAREALERSIAFWEMCPAHVALPYKSFPLHFCPIYCPSDPRYARDVISIMEELAPILGIEERRAI